MFVGEENKKNEKKQKKLPLIVRASEEFGADLDEIWLTMGWW